MGTLLKKGEQVLFDNVNVEIQTLAGVGDGNCILWKFLKVPPGAQGVGVSGFIDCLYGEPVLASRHYQPYKINAYFERPTQDADATDEGMTVTKTSKVTISRKGVEIAKVPASSNRQHVNVGDILEFFRKGNAFFFEVKNCEQDGWINDQDQWTQYLADVVNINYFTPDRKLLGST